MIRKEKERTKERKEKKEYNKVKYTIPQMRRCIVADYCERPVRYLAWQRLASLAMSHRWKDSTHLNFTFKLWDYYYYY